MQTSLNKDNLKQAIPIQQISTFDMLAIVQKKPVSIIVLLGCKDQSEQLEWTELAHAVKVLSVFDDLTTKISAEANVSLSRTTIVSRIMTKVN